MTVELDLVGLIVADMGKSLAFYRRLGLAVPAAADSESHVETGLPGGLRIAWDTAELIAGIDPAWTPPSGGHRISLAFRCGSPAEVDRTHQELVGAGYESALAPWDAFWGQRYAQVHDPDGNAIDLFAPLG